MTSDAQFAIWVAAHSEADVGTMTVPAPTTLWFPTGADVVGAGVHGMRDLGRRMADPGPSRIAIDVWGHVTGDAPAGSWAAEPPGDEAAGAELERQLRRYWTATEWLARHMPQCHDWAADAVKVVVPLRGGPGLFRSGSSPDLPAAIQLDLMNEVQILEGLVHEAAHLYLFREEAGGPLVDPNDTGRFPSPLRPEPRPLRGILLAFHALAYICALYSGVLARTEPERSGVRAQYDDSQGRARDAEHVLLTEQRRLTARGAAFLDQTRSALHPFYA